LHERFKKRGKFGKGGFGAFAAGTQDNVIAVTESQRQKRIETFGVNARFSFAKRYVACKTFRFRAKTRGGAQMKAVARSDM
jgi:hypothetical protein